MHHTPNPHRGFEEITGVLKPGGHCFVMLYGKGGLRWPTVMRLRPHAQAIGYERVDKAIQLAGLPANKRRTLLDDWFVPHIKFHDGDEIEELFSSHGYRNVVRWTKGKLDHEESVESQALELKQMVSVFEAGLAPDAPKGFANARDSLLAARDVGSAALEELHAVESSFASGLIDDQERDWRVNGWGHFRMLAVRA